MRHIARILVVVTLVASAVTTVIPPSASTAGIDNNGLGARYTGAGSSIAFWVFSSRATRVEVYVYGNPMGGQETSHHLMAKGAGDIWSVTVSLPGTVFYGYRAWGPNWPYNPAWVKGSTAGHVSDVDSAGNRFNPNKLLLDPYAQEISHDPQTPSHPNESDYGAGASRAMDTGTFAPKGIVLAASTGGIGVKPARALKDDIIYEVHLRGFTRNDSSITSGYRGTYKGAGLKAGYLKSLGVTAVEFLPLQETQNDHNDIDPNSASGDNYWGYLTLNYFAPDRRYSSDKSPGGPTREFKEMVKAFHDNGIKVLVDVVYNHTGEPPGRIFSFRGLDNPTYYSLTSDRQNQWDNTGVGGNYNTFNPVAQDLIVDSVAYWKNTLGVDGFRFDLASVLGNTCQHGCFRYSRNDPGTALNRLTAEMPARPATGGMGVDWIAEPWAIGAGTYQVGNFPPAWAEWNGIYRDSLRRDQNKMGVRPVTPGEVASRFAGSSDLYGDDGRRPWHSVNFMVAHDGLTLKDLYSCNGKNNNQPWPNGPSDGGTDDEDSWNQGGNAAEQRKAARNGFAFLMLSAGTPMMTGGDEMLRTLNCHNNPYNVDSGFNWLTFATSDFYIYAQRLIAFRKAHPALRPSTFYTSTQLQWFTPTGATPDQAYWSNVDNHALAWRTNGGDFGDVSLYTAYNGWSGQVTFTLPAPPAGKQWHRVTDTSVWAEGPHQVANPGTETLIGGTGTTYVLHPRALLLLIAK